VIHSRLADATSSTNLNFLVQENEKEKLENRLAAPGTKKKPYFGGGRSFEPSGWREGKKTHGVELSRAARISFPVPKYGLEGKRGKRKGKGREPKVKNRAADPGAPGCSAASLAALKKEKKKKGGRERRGVLHLPLVQMFYFLGAGKVKRKKGGREEEESSEAKRLDGSSFRPARIF